MEWRDTTIIIKFNVIIFVRLRRWNFSLLTCNKIFSSAGEWYFKAYIIWQHFPYRETIDRFG